MPHPLEVGAASSSIPDAEATSLAPADWVRGGGTGPLNQAILDVQGKLQAEADALKQCNQAFLDSRAAIRVCSFIFDSCISYTSLWGRASAPTGCSPRASCWLSSRRLGALIGELRVLT